MRHWNTLLIVVVQEGLCFSDKKTLSCFTNTFFISLDSCNNRTFHGICKTEQEINEFLNSLVQRLCLKGPDLGEAMPTIMTVMEYEAYVFVYCFALSRRV